MFLLNILNTYIRIQFRSNQYNTMTRDINDYNLAILIIALKCNFLLKVLNSKQRSRTKFIFKKICRTFLTKTNLNNSISNFKSS